MRISDWSSDVCSSDLWRGFRSRRSGRRRSCGGVREMAKIKIKQVGSPIRRPESQRKVLIGLGLNKLHRVVEHEDTPEIRGMIRSEEHTSELQSLMRISYAVFCLQKQKHYTEAYRINLTTSQIKEHG